MSQESIASIQDIAALIEEKAAKCHNLTSGDCKQMELNIEKKNLLLVTIIGQNHFKLSSRIMFMKTNYELLSLSSIDSERIKKTTFKCNGIFFTSENDSVPEVTDLSKPQRINIALFVKENLEKSNKNQDKFIFNQSSLDTFTKEAYKSTDRVKYDAMKLKRKNEDIERDKTEKRKKMHQEKDKDRDQTEKRKKMHQDIDKERDQTEKRKKMHQDIDKERDQTEERKKMHQDIDKERD